MLSVYVMSNMCINCAGVKFGDCLLANPFWIQSLNDSFIEAETSIQFLFTNEATYLNRIFSVYNLIAVISLAHQLVILLRYLSYLFHVLLSYSKSNQSPK